jgi:hypothetical protein
MVQWQMKMPSGKGRSFSIQLDVEALRKKIRASREQGIDVRAIFIDPVVEHLGDIDEWKGRQVVDTLAPLVQMAKDEDLAIIGIMHVRKASDGQRVLTNIGNSMAFNTLPRAIAFTKELEDASGKLMREFVLIWEKASLSRGRPLALRYKAVDVPVEPVNDGDETITSASCIEWLGTMDVRMRELLGERKVTKKDEAIEWLEERLSNGPEYAEVIAAEAKAKGFKPGVLHRAREDLGIESSPEGFGGKRKVSLPEPAF